MAATMGKDASLWSWTDVNAGHYQQVVDNYTVSVSVDRLPR